MTKTDYVILFANEVRVNNYGIEYRYILGFKAKARYEYFVSRQKIKTGMLLNYVKFKTLEEAKSYYDSRSAYG